jgi:hypothetical protein
MRKDDIKAILAAVGPRGFEKVWGDLLEGRNADGTQRPKLDPNSVSIQALYEGLVGSKDSLPSYARSSSAYNYIELQEQVESTAFPSAIGMLIASRVMDAYNQIALVGDSLVTKMTSRQRNERIVGFTSLEGPLEVAEGTPYQESGFGEKYVTTEAFKKGRIIEVTEEAIFFDQTGQILMRASRIGEMAAQERERTILAGVLDVGSGAAGYHDVYRPNGVATPLYTAPALLATPTPLTTWQQFNTVLQHHALNITDDRAVVGEREPILWNPRQVLVARQNLGTISSIMAATMFQFQPGATDASVVTTGPNPLSSLMPGLSVVSSPMVDFLANVPGSRYDDARDWFVGDFPKQFVWNEIWPIQTSRSRQDDEAAFRRDIIARFKVRYFGGIAAIDNKYVVKVNAA